jgi:hypothetical protein
MGETLQDRLKNPPTTYQGGQVGACTLIPSKWLREAADALDAKDARIAQLEAELERRDLYRGSDGCSTGDCPHDSVHECTAAQGAIIQEQSALIAKLEAYLAEARGVVERLPDTHDEKPIVEGDDVWWVVPEDPEYWGYAIGEPVEFIVASTRLGIDFVEYNGTHTVMLQDGPECGNKDLYSTREAALADWHEDELGVFRRTLPDASGGGA